MDQARQFYHYHLKWTPDRKVQICEGPGWLSRLFILNGPGRPNLPDQPITKSEFYVLLSDLAAKGYMDNLLDF